MNKKMFDVDVSVIIPFYKEIDIICNAVASVQNQFGVENLNIEIVIGNDGQYSTEQILNALPPSSLSITKIATNTGAHGAGNARNVAIATAKGAIFAFLDADDIWQPDKLFNQLKYINCGCNFVVGAYRFSGLKAAIFPPLSIHSTIDFLRNSSIGASTVLVTRELIGEDRFTNLLSSQDTEFWARLAGKNDFRYGCTRFICTIYSPSPRTANKLREFMRFKNVVNLFDLNLYDRFIIYMRYAIRGFYFHFIKRKILYLISRSEG